MTRQNRILVSHKGRVEATSDEQAAKIIHDRYPNAIRVTIMGPTNDGRYEWVVVMGADDE